jgi:hypothetical protein
MLPAGISDPGYNRLHPRRHVAASSWGLKKKRIKDWPQRALTAQRLLCTFLLSVGGKCVFGVTDIFGFRGVNGIFTDVFRVIANALEIARDKE